VTKPGLGVFSLITISDSRAITDCDQ